MPRDGLGVRIAVVKLLFPPGEKKGANDTLELAAPPSPLWRVSDTHTAPL